MKNRLIALAIVAGLTSSYAVNAKMVTTSKALYPTTETHTTTSYNYKVIANSHKSKAKMIVTSHNVSTPKAYETKLPMFLPYHQWWPAY